MSVVSRFADWSLRRKIITLVVGAPLACCLVLTPVVWRGWDGLRTKVDAELKDAMQQRIGQIAKDAHALCEAVHEMGTRQNQANLRLATDLVRRQGGLAPGGGAVTWNAVDQFSGAARPVALPRMELGGRWLGQQRTFDAAVPVVDDVQRLGGGVCTIFQRMNDRGDMLRVATSVAKKDGTRAIGTYIPAVEPDGKRNPVVEAVLAGRSYEGRAFVVDAWNLARYEPVKDASGRVTGMIFVGTKQEAIPGLRRELMDMQVGKTGYVYVLGGSGDQKGHYIVSAGGKRDGEDLWDKQDAAGRYFIREIVDTATKTGHEGVSFIRYPWQNQGEPLRTKVVALTYFEPWDWVIGAGMIEDEALETTHTVQSALVGVALRLAAIGLPLGLLFAFAGVIVVGRITRPIEAMTATAEGLAKGDIDQEVAHRSGDEVGRLADSFRSVIASLRGKAEAAERMARGELDVEIAALSPRDTLARSMETMRVRVKALAGDVQALAAAAIEGRLDQRADPATHAGEFRVIVEGLNATLDAVIRPLEVAATCLDRIARGEIPPPITEDFKGEFGRMRDNLNTCTAAVGALVRDVRELATAALDGRLSARADGRRHAGDFKEIVEGINATLDAVVGPLMTAAESFERIARGDLPEKIPGPWMGEFERMRSSIDTCIDAVGALIGDVRQLAAAAVSGQLSERADASRHQGEFGRIVTGFNETLDAVIVPLRDAASNFERIARGEIPARIETRQKGEFQAITDSLNTCIDAVNALVSDSVTLSRAALAGELSTRADAGKHRGDFRRIVQGVNETLDAVIGPLATAADCVDRIARGDVPEPIATTFRGDFERLRTNLNTCIGAIRALVDDAHRLAAAAVAGQLGTRADAARHQGDFRAIVQGVNETLDAVIGPLQAAASHVDRIAQGDIPAAIATRWPGEFDALRANLDTCTAAVRGLVADAQRLADAAVQGDLSVRADAARHQGDFRRIVEGVNRTLEALTVPVAEAASVLERVAARDLSARVTGDYQGDHARIKDALNRAVTNLDEGMQEMARAADEVARAAAQIETASGSLARGSADQASSVEEIGATMQEMSSMTRRNTESARQAEQLAARAVTDVAEGVSSMERLSDVVGRIKTSSDQTAKIVHTIDEIAFQTNLLALNAAVEAARAGDAGRGFAVVAEEVRNLALRSADAARQTAELIEEAVRNAEQGVTTNVQVREALTGIDTHARRVSEVMREIASASEQQQVGVDQVSTAMEQVSGVTQQTAASAEESAAVAQELSGQAGSVRDLVRSFRLTS